MPGLKAFSAKVQCDSVFLLLLVVQVITEGDHLLHSLLIFVLPLTDRWLRKSV